MYVHVLARYGGRVNHYSIGQRCDRNVSPYVGSYAISLIVVITEHRVGKIGRNSALPRLDEARDGAA